MYEFNYHRPGNLEEAQRLFHGSDDASYLAGGHTLLPTMKNRLAAPSDLIDLRNIPDLKGISCVEGRLIIGAAETHFDVSSSAIVLKAIPALAALAGSIGDVQVRYCGTIGGSLANNDPAADYPSAVLGLGAEIYTNKRCLHSDAFFDGLYTTALDEGEIILRISFPVPDTAGYAKIRNPASRYPIAATFVSKIDRLCRVAVTGAGNNGVFRWSDAENVLNQGGGSAGLIGLQPDEDLMLDDLHAGQDYRAHLVGVLTRRAVDAPGQLTLC